MIMSLALIDPEIADLLILPAFAPTHTTLADYAISFRILVDTGSQLDFITPSLAESLHLTSLPFAYLPLSLSNLQTVRSLLILSHTMLAFLSVSPTPLSLIQWKRTLADLADIKRIM